MRFLLFFTVVLMACSGTASLPKDVLPPDQMSNVLYDVIKADEMVDFLQIADSTYRPFSRRASIYDTIFHFHAVKKEVFQKSLKFYQARPDLLKTVIEKMQKKISDTTGAKKAEVIS